MTDLETSKITNDRLVQGRLHAEFFVRTFGHFFKRVEIAGSIRRRTPSPRDIEIVGVCEPLQMPGLRTAMVGYGLRDAPFDGVWGYVPLKPNTRSLVVWPLKLEAKYWKLAEWRDKLELIHPGWISGHKITAAIGWKIDLFFATEENFGLIWLIRTGPGGNDFQRNFGARILQRWKKISNGGFSREGHLYVPTTIHGRKDFIRVPTPTEESVFELVKMRFVPPEERENAWQRQDLWK